MDVSKVIIESKEMLHNDRWVWADRIDIVFPDGRKIADFLRITSKSGGYVGVIGITKDGFFILTKQYKPVAGQSIEFVAGSREQDETWEQAACREMIEETGYEPGRLVAFGGGFFTQTDRIDNPCHIFLAFDCVKAKKKLKGEEIQDIELCLVKPEEAINLIKGKEIKDIPTICAILAYLSLEKLNLNSG